MSDNDFSRDPFAILRTAGQGAQLPPVAVVRQRGRRRQTRARAGYALTTVALVAGGSSFALATGGHHPPGPDSSLSMTALMTHSTDAPTPSPSATPTGIRTDTPNPTAFPSGMESSTAAPTPSTSPSISGSPSADPPPKPTPYLTVVLTLTSPPGSSTPTYKAVFSGLVPRLYVAQTADPQNYGYIRGAEQIRNTRVFLDGVNMTGSDGGDMGCKEGAPLVQLAQGPFRGRVEVWKFPTKPAESLTGPFPLSRGTHKLTFVANACFISAQDTVTFTVN